MSEIAGKQLELARHYASIGQPQRVLEALDGADDFKEPESWSLRGEALYHLDRYSEGAAAARRGLELEPEHMELLDVLALNLIELGELDQAEEPYFRLSSSRRIIRPALPLRARVCPRRRAHEGAAARRQGRRPRPGIDRRPAHAGPGRLLEW